MYPFVIKKLVPNSPNTSDFIQNKQSLVSQTCYVLLPTSLKLTAELQKGKIKQVDIGITSPQKNHRKIGLGGI